MFHLSAFIQRIPKKDILITIIIILVGTASYALGKLSGVFVNEPVKIEYGDTRTAISTSTNQTASVVKSLKTEPIDAEISKMPGAVVTSKTGKKYYYPNCSGVARISSANRVWFSSGKEAEKRGYTLASNCTPSK